jgi:tetratricopeptide (TPR) repeat protein
MKNILYVILAVILSISVCHSQDFQKNVKKAKRALNKYNLDPKANEADLMEAMNLIIEAFDAPEAANDFDAQASKGRILAEVYANENAKVLLDPNYQMVNENIVFDAADALMQALGLADKGWKKDDVMESLTFNAVNLSNAGIRAFQSENFKVAYNAFNETLNVKEVLDENKKGDMYLSKPDELNNQKYYTALAAQLDENYPRAKDLYESLLDGGFNTADIYQGLYTVTVENNSNEALSYLEAGRKMYPDSTSLLYTEINHYLKSGEIESLEDKLKQGIEKDPSNASLHITLGNVYDRLYQKAAEAGNEEEANAYFEQAIQKYEDAISINDDLNDAYYSIGALYYNKAAEVSSGLEALANDFSKEGMKKYDALNTEVLSYFDKALPWFKKSETMEPNDVNTLIALKEIYAKKDELEKAQIFTDRLEKVKAGETLESYFK